MSAPPAPTAQKSVMLLGDLLAGCRLLAGVSRSAAFVALQMRLRSAVFQHYALYGEEELCWLAPYLFAVDPVYYLCGWLRTVEPPAGFVPPTSSGLFAGSDLAESE